MSNVVRAPRGYLIVQGDPGFTGKLDLSKLDETQPDEEVARLYEITQKLIVNIDSWRFRAEVISCAARLFQNFNLWLSLNAAGNDYIYDLNWRLVEDTVQFIRTGHRDISLPTMKELILEHPVARKGVATPRRLDALKIQPNEFDDAVARWCSQEGGFMDMLKTMHLLFGVTMSPKVAPPKIP